MRAWHFSAGVLVLVVFFINIQILEALPKENSSHGSQKKVVPDFRQIQLTEAESQVVKDFKKCAEKWTATIGEDCIREEFLSELLLAGSYFGNAPGMELKKIYTRVCQTNLTCSNDGVCACRDSSENSSSCADQTFPKKDLRADCNSQSKAYLNLIRRAVLKIPIGPNERNTGSSVIDPGQSIRYIIFMALIQLCVLVAH